MNKSTVTLHIKLANYVISQSDINASEGVHTAGWALREQYMKAALVTPRVSLLQLMDYIEGRVMLIPAEWEWDVFSGKVIYRTGDSMEGDIRVVRRESPFYDIAKRKLDAVLEGEPARTFLADYGVKLRDLPGLVEQHKARSDYYAIRDGIKPVVEGIKPIADALAAKIIVQEMTLAKLLVGTPLEGQIPEDSRKRLTLDKVRGACMELLEILESYRIRAFEPLRPVDAQDALTIVGNPHCRKLIEQYASRLALQLHRKRFWLAFAFTQGELYERITRVKPALLDVSKLLEDADEPLSLLGYYDAFDRASIAEFSDPEEDRLEHDNMKWAGLEDVAQLMSDTLEIREDMYYSEDGSRVDPSAFSGGDTTFEDLVASNKIPVHIHRAIAVEAKIKSLRETKRELEDIAALVGKRANDEEWVIERSEFDLLDMKEDARKLMLPTQAEIDNGETNTYVNPTKAKLDIERATATLDSGKRYI